MSDLEASDLEVMRNLWEECTREGNQPDLIVVDRNTWEDFQYIINAPRWMHWMWRLTFGYFPAGIKRSR